MIFYSLPSISQHFYPVICIEPQPIWQDKYVLVQLFISKERILVSIVAQSDKEVCSLLNYMNLHAYA